MIVTEIAEFWKKHVCPISVYMKREKSDEEKLATCSMEFLEHLIGHRPYAQ
jgi:hypothetical protein